MAIIAPVPNSIIYPIQIYRGFAAIAVVLFHAAFILHTQRGSAGIGSLFSWGFSGVQFFFVLSGFVICFIHHSDIGKPERGLVYLKKRFIRIYPIYWIVLLLTLLFVFQFDKPLHIRHMVENFTLLRLTGFDKFVPVAWTLSHEIVFYSIFLILVLSRAAGLALVTLWIGICTYQIITGEPPPVPYTLSAVTGIDYGAFTNLMTITSAPINFLFGLGALSFYAYRKLITSLHQDRISSAAFILGVAGFAAACGAWLLEDRYLDWNGYNAAFGFASFFLILGSASTKLNNWASSQKALLFFGNASYAIYLAHYGIQQVLVKSLPVSLGTNWSFLLLSSLSVLAGIVLHVGIEKPILRFFGRTRTTPTNPQALTS